MPPHKWVNAICAHCSNRFTNWRFGRPRKYCEDACRQAAYRARQKAKREAEKPRTITCSTCNGQGIINVDALRLPPVIADQIAMQ